LKPVAELAAQSLATVSSFAVGLGTLAAKSASQPVGDLEAYVIAFWPSAVGAILASLAARMSAADRVAMGLSCLAMGVMIGPFATHLLIAVSAMQDYMSVQVLIGVAFLTSLFGWPIYKATRALFLAAEENAGGAPQFLSAAIKAFLSRLK